MLYDPKWQAPVKADPFKLETLIAWLEKQPADKEYSYFCNGHCLLAQYFQQNGFPNSSMLGPYLMVDGRQRDIPKNWDALAQGWIVTRDGNYDSSIPDRTFGAALERARKLAPVRA